MGSYLPELELTCCPEITPHFSCFSWEPLAFL